MIGADAMATFVAVVEASSISQAAQRLGIVKSVVSRRIRDLEHELGVALLDRAGNRIRPTEVGAVYYAKCVRILGAIESAHEFVSGYSRMLGGRLRVSASPTLLSTVLAPHLAKFAHAYPTLVLDIEADGLPPDFQSRGYDVAFRLGRQPDSSLLTRSLDSVPYVICASPDYLNTHGPPQHPSELDHHAGLLHIPSEPNGLWVLAVDGELRSFRVRERLRSNCRIQLARAAEAGLGLLFTPRYAVNAAIASGRLHTVLDSFVPASSKIVVLYPQSRRHSKKVQILIEFLDDHLRGASLDEIPASDQFRDI